MPFTQFRGNPERRWLISTQDFVGLTSNVFMLIITTPIWKN